MSNRPYATKPIEYNLKMSTPELQPIGDDLMNVKDILEGTNAPWRDRHLVSDLICEADKGKMDQSKIAKVMSTYPQTAHILKKYVV